ncbi:Fc.00g043010.m01.CDS01 [Cosmosporella sp. VM-42]
MSPRLNTLLTKWHRLLDLPRQSPPSWYRDRLMEELYERRTAITFWNKLSETSDVFFSLSRAKYDGYPLRELPPFSIFRHGAVFVYMFAKYSFRWGFYRIAAKLCTREREGLVREVVNPAKDAKLDEVAGRHGLDKEEFRRVGKRLRYIWPLLP